MPAGTAVRKLAATLDEAIALRETSSRSSRWAWIPEGPSSTDELRRYISSEIARLAKVV